MSPLIFTDAGAIVVSKISITLLQFQSLLSKSRQDSDVHSTFLLHHQKLIWKGLKLHDLLKIPFLLFIIFIIGTFRILVIIPGNPASELTLRMAHLTGII